MSNFAYSNDYYDEDMDDDDCFVDDDGERADYDDSMDGDHENEDIGSSGERWDSGWYRQSSIWGRE